LIILGHIFTFKHLCLHSITKILRNGPKAHFPFNLAAGRHDDSRPRRLVCFELISFIVYLGCGVLESKV
jgi:hypothetical protein